MNVTKIGKFGLRFLV